MNREYVEREYTKAREASVHRLTRLLEALTNVEATDVSDVDWGHVGSLNKVHEDLGEVCRFLGVDVDR